MFLTLNIKYLHGRVVNALVSFAEGLEFKIRADQILRSVANGSLSLGTVPQRYRPH